MRSLMLIGTLLALASASTAQALLPGAVLRSPWIAYPTATYPEGTWPVASAVADFNNDNVPDLATVSWGGNGHLSIQFGDGRGRFGPSTLYALTMDAMDLAVADFDRDGDVDIVVAETGDLYEGTAVSLWKNNGDGTFGLPTLFNTGDDGPSGITVGDFDRDGWMDAVVAHDEYINLDNTIALLKNDKSGGFLSPVVVVVASGTTDLDSGDLDFDGDPDIVVALKTNAWAVVRNDNGTLVPVGTVPGVPGAFFYQQAVVALGDVDGDADLDVLFSTESTGGNGTGAFGLWRNLGNGTFGSAEQYSLQTPLDPVVDGATDLDVADVTGDGKPDILAANGAWYVFANNGSGGFLPARMFRAGDMRDGWPAIDVEAVDIDRDGDRDVVVAANGSMDACVYLNPGHGEFVQPTPLPMADPALAPAFPLKLWVDDVDQDGDLDLICGYNSFFSNRYALTVRRNNGKSVFGNIEEYVETGEIRDLTIADLNADGKKDLLFLLATGQFVVRTNQSGTFSTRIAGPNFNTGYDYTQIGVADVDNDADLDVVVNAGFGIKISRNLGNNSFGAPTYHDVGGWVTAFGFGDFNKDGKVDLLTNSGVQGFPQISLGNGNGTFGSPTTFSTGRDVRWFATGDLDKDGNLDFATYYNLDEKGLGVRRGRGQGSFFLAFKQPGAYYAGDFTGTLDLVDLDADGVLDAMAGSFGGQDLAYWRGVGDGTFENQVRFGIGWDVFDIEPGDFDGDGRRDVAAICQVDNGAWWYPGVVIIKNPGRRLRIVTPR